MKALCQRGTHRGCLRATVVVQTSAERTARHFSATGDLVRDASFRLGQKNAQRRLSPVTLKVLFESTLVGDVFHVVRWFDTRVRFTIFSVPVLAVPSLVWATETDPFHAVHLWSSSVGDTENSMNRKTLPGVALPEHRCSAPRNATRECV